MSLCKFASFCCWNHVGTNDTFKNQKGRILKWIIDAEYMSEDIDISTSTPRDSVGHCYCYSLRCYPLCYIALPPHTHSHISINVLAIVDVQKRSASIYFMIEVNIRIYSCTYKVLVKDCFLDETLQNEIMDQFCCIRFFGHHFIVKTMVVWLV